MKNSDFETEFALVYELCPGDLRDVIEKIPGRKDKRFRAISAAVWVVLFAAGFSAVTIALELPSVVKNSTGAPSWMYVVCVILWYFAVKFVLVSWRMSPKRIARRAWRKYSRIRGIHRDEVGSDGVSDTEPDGTQTIIPWARIDDIRETGNNFCLVDHHGSVVCVLPKRGLSTPDLVPALREFLNHSVYGKSGDITPNENP